MGVDVSAHEIEVPNTDGVTIYYNYINNNTELAVTFAGSWYGYVKNEYSGVVVIPEEVTLEGSKLKVTRIDNSAFSGCYDLTSITIPNSVTSIGDYAFCECRSLTSVIIPDGITSIEKYTFESCSGLTSVIIPNSVTSIGDYAFDGCTSLASIIIPNHVTTIGIGAFGYCNGLTSIDIPNSVTSIEDYTFEGCKNLTSITIGNSVASIGNYAFAGCRSLTSVTIPNSVTSLGEYAFYKCYGLTSIDIGDGVTSIGNSAFWECTSLPSVTIGNSVTTIGEWAFYNCSNLKSITIPRSVTHIGNSVFFNCYDLNKVYISDLEAWCNIQFDGDFFSRYHLYLNNKEITNLIIPESVTSIGNYAFAKCYRLISITIPSGVTNIGDYAFWFCSNLQNIYCYAEQVTEIGNNVFENSNYDATLHVPAASISAYQAAESWKNFKEIVALPDQASQDEYRPFVEEGKVWKVGHVQTILDNSVNVVDYYYFDGDTIIDGKTCKQMMCQRYVSPDYSNEYGTPTPSLTKVGAWYEEDKKVYFYNEWQQSMKLKYDFSLAANDTLKFLTDGSSPFIIGPKQTGGIEGFKGVYRDIRMCGDEGQSYHDTFWLEGVGCLRGPIRNPCDPIFGDPVPEFLMSCTVGDEVIYLNDDYEDGATPEGMGARKKRFDFTHTIKTKPKSRMKSGAEESMYGEYNDKQLCIHLDPFDETYLVSITDETDKNVYQKAIYAGSIVALNIDISNFTKGHYTVTVENSSEYFTGEFNAQTTGIDVDGDGILTAKDITAVVNSIASKTIDESIKSAADVNGDKMVNIADIVRIANKIMVTDSLTTNP